MILKNLALRPSVLKRNHRSFVTAENRMSDRPRMVYSDLISQASPSSSKYQNNKAALGRRTPRSPN